MTEQTDERGRGKKSYNWLHKKKGNEEEVKESGADLSMKEKVDKLYGYFEKADEKGKSFEKRMKLPAKVKRIVKKPQQNKVIALVLKANRTIQPQAGQIKEGFVTVGSYFYDGSPKYMWMWRGKTPAVVIPEWDLQPLSASELFDRTKENNSPSDPARIILRAMKSSEIKNIASSPMNMKMIVGVGIAVIVVGYIILGG